MKIAEMASVLLDRGRYRSSIMSAFPNSSTLVLYVNCDAEYLHGRTKNGSHTYQNTLELVWFTAFQRFSPEQVNISH